jgi:hypothetical protein
MALLVLRSHRRSAGTRTPRSPYPGGTTSDMTTRGCCAKTTPEQQARTILAEVAILSAMAHSCARRTRAAVERTSLCVNGHKYELAARCGPMPIRKAPSEAIVVHVTSVGEKGYQRLWHRRRK